MVGSKEYLADSATGEVRIPYRSPHAKGPSHLVLGDSHGFAAVVKNWTHMNEQFSLSVGFHLEREACTAGSHAPLVIRPALTVSFVVNNWTHMNEQFDLSVCFHLEREACTGGSHTPMANGWPAPLAMLKDVQLVISTQDSSGTRTKQTVNDFELGDGVQAVVHSVLIPERCVQVDFQLSARVRKVDCLLSARVRKVHPGQDGGVEYQDLSEGKSFALGEAACPSLQESSMTDTNGELHLGGLAGEAACPSLQESSMTDTNGELHLGGLAGEAACPSVQKSLMTDTNGELHLGSLAGITRLTAICSDLPHSQQQGLSLQENEFVCLLEFNDRMKETVRDVTSLYVSNMEQPKGHLVLRGLPPGTYLLAAPATRGVGEGDQLMTLTVVQPLASGGGGGILTRGTQR
eukprot:gene28417-31560_t